MYMHVLYVHAGLCGAIEGCIYMYTMDYVHVHACTICTCRAVWGNRGLYIHVYNGLCSCTCMYYMYMYMYMHATLSN